MAMAEQPNIAELVIQAFGGLTKTSEACGHRHVTTVDGWRRSGRIPSWRRPELIAAADRLGVTLPDEFLRPAIAASEAA